MQLHRPLVCILTALALALPSQGRAESDGSSSCPRPERRPAPGEQGPIGSMQRDELLADGLGQKEDECRTAHTPLISELTRHVARWGDDIWWNDGSGMSLGLVHRARWRQFFRDHFVYFDDDGARRAEGTQPRLSAGMVYTTLGELYVTDANHELLVYMHGSLWTWAKVRFALEDKHGQRLADAHIDLKNSSVVFTRPDNARVRIASLLREQATDDGFDRWRMMVLREDVLPDDAWPVLAAFFVRYQDPSTLTAWGRSLRSSLGGG